MSLAYGVLWCLFHFIVHTPQFRLYQYEYAIDWGMSTEQIWQVDHWMGPSKNNAQPVNKRRLHGTNDIHTFIEPTPFTIQQFQPTKPPCCMSHLPSTYSNSLMVFPQKIMSSVVHSIPAFMLTCNVIGMVAELLDVKDLGSLCMASHWFNAVVCSTQQLQKQFLFALCDMSCGNNDNGDNTPIPMEVCPCDHHHFIIHWMQVQIFGRWFSQHLPQSLFRCVHHVQVDVMRFTCNPWSWRVDSADDFPIFLDVVGIISSLPAVHEVNVHFSGRYYKTPWLQPLMDWNEEKASHIRTIEKFYSGQGILVQVMGREVIETLYLW